MVRSGTVVARAGSPAIPKSAETVRSCVCGGSPPALSVVAGRPAAGRPQSPRRLIGPPPANQLPPHVKPEAFLQLPLNLSFNLPPTRQEAVP